MISVKHRKCRSVSRTGVTGTAGNVRARQTDSRADRTSTESPNARNHIIQQRIVYLENKSRSGFRRLESGIEPEPKVHAFFLYRKQPSAPGRSPDGNLKRARRMPLRVRGRVGFNRLAGAKFARSDRRGVRRRRERSLGLSRESLSVSAGSGKEDRKAPLRPRRRIRRARTPGYGGYRSGSQPRRLRIVLSSSLDFSKSILRLSTCEFAARDSRQVTEGGTRIAGKRDSTAGVGVRSGRD